MSGISCVSMCIWALLLWFISSSRLCSCLHDKYAECRVPVYCGNKHQVRYPFYLEGRQPSYCGLPGYNVSCVNQDDPFPLSLTLPTSTYYYNTSKGGVDEVRPHSITYRLKILGGDNRGDGFGIRVSNEALSKVEETCTLPERELEVLRDPRFDFKWGLGYNWVVMYGECNKPLASNLIRYATSNCSDPILFLRDDDRTYSRDYVNKECNRNVPFFTVEDDFFIPTSSGGGRVANWSAYKTLMARRGLELVWRFPSCESVSVHDNNGSECYCSDHEGNSITCPRPGADKFQMPKYHH